MLDLFILQRKINNKQCALRTSQQKDFQMPRPKMTEAHRMHMRAQILDRAYAILVEEGPGNISSRAIAQHLDLTHMGLFTYFPNQGAILRALAEREQSKLLVHLQSFPQRAINEDITLVVEEALSYIQTFAGHEPNLFRLVWLDSEVMDQESQPTWIKSTIGLIAEMIRSGVEQGIFHTGDAQSAAALVIGLVNMPSVFAYSGKIKEPEEKDMLNRQAVAAAMLYLREGAESGLQSEKALPGWLAHLRRLLKKIL
jgi:TetR/AcrR family transcriptional regulator